jgi:hypothetical protein
MTTRPTERKTRMAAFWAAADALTAHTGACDVCRLSLASAFDAAPPCVEGAALFERWTAAREAVAVSPPGCD